MRILLGLALTAGNCLGQVYGTWKMDALHSTFTGETQPKSVTLRIQKHPKGEVVTVDRVDVDGRTTSSSTILYFDGTPRDFEDFQCSGTQSSRRIDSQSIELVRVCKSGERSKMTRRSSAQWNELVLEIVVHQAKDRWFQRRLVFKRQ
jgi:uncharacterized ParB-like nuclease family protein